jgi:hypothetical protein
VLCIVRVTRAAYVSVPTKDGSSVNVQRGPHAHEVQQLAGPNRSYRFVSPDDVSTGETLVCMRIDHPQASLLLTGREPRSTADAAHDESHHGSVYQDENVFPMFAFLGVAMQEASPAPTQLLIAGIVSARTLVKALQFV